MHRFLVYILAILLLAALAPLAQAKTMEPIGDTEAASTEPEPEPEEPSVKPPPKRELIRAYNKRPKKRIKVTKKFKPSAKPSPQEVKKIIGLEQKRWGGTAITRRVACESEFRWNATNGQYRGLLQIGPWWDYAYNKTPRLVKLKKTKKIRKPVRRIRIYSDGYKSKRFVKMTSVKKRIIRKGKLPKKADPYHGWAAVRVGQRAVSGDGPSTAWSCRL
jgi:hypothetical protein